MFNFAVASRLALEAGAAAQADDAAALMQLAASLLSDPQRRQAMSRAGIEFSQAHRGATDRIIALLPTLP